MHYEIIPAILVENLEEFDERIQVAEDFAETVQWDVMDGQFVEQMTFNDPSELMHIDTTLTIEAHLMVENPEIIFDDLAKAGIDRVIVHAEASDDLEKMMTRLMSYDFEKGIAISPETDIDLIRDYIDQLDEVIVMTVVPGASGQSFMEEQLDKVRELRKDYPDLNIAVDGGVNIHTIKIAKEAGANLFGANSVIFKSPDPANAFELLKAAIE